MYIVSSRIGKPLIKDPNVSYTPSFLVFFVTTSSCAMKSAPLPPFLPILWQPELHYQCTIQFRRGRLHNLWENRLDCFNLNMFSELLYLFCKTFWICFAFYSEKSVQELQRWVTLYAPLITSELRTMMRKKLTNSQLIMMSRNVRICLTKFPHRCVTWNQDVWYLRSDDDCDDHSGRSKTSMTWLPIADMTRWFQWDTLALILTHP